MGPADPAVQVWVAAHAAWLGGVPLRYRAVPVPESLPQEGSFVQVECLTRSLHGYEILLRINRLGLPTRFLWVEVTTIYEIVD